MASLARDLDDTGASFRWDKTRRAQIRAELDAGWAPAHTLHAAQLSSAQPSPDRPVR